MPFIILNVNCVPLKSDFAIVKRQFHIKSLAWQGWGSQ